MLKIYVDGKQKAVSDKFNPTDYNIANENPLKIGFGQQDFENIKILGDPLPDIACTDFEPADLMPIRFSLFRVCKSITKQILLKAKSKSFTQH